MRNWLHAVLSDNNDKPSEIIVLMVGADFLICILACVLIWMGHAPTLPEFSGSIAAIHGIGHAGQWANNG